MDDLGGMITGEGIYLLEGSANIHGDAPSTLTTSTLGTYSLYSCSQPFDSLSARKFSSEESQNDSITISCIANIIVISRKGANAGPQIERFYNPFTTFVLSAYIISRAPLNS